MRVWQPGSYMTRQRGAEVDDWSWKTTVRRVTTLARLTETLGVETEAPMGSALIRQIEKRVAANKARA